MICKPIETSDPFDMSKQIPEKGQSILFLRRSMIFISGGPA